MFNRRRDPGKTADTGSLEVTEGERIGADTIRTGTLEQADYTQSPPRARVRLGDADDPDGSFLTDWLPMMMGRSDEWNPLRVGESVTVLSESGEIQNGRVMPGASTFSGRANVGDRADLWRKRFDDGAVLEYDQASGALLFQGMQRARVVVGGATLEVVDGTIMLSAGGATLVVSSAGVAVTGQALTHAGKSVGSTHTHLGVQPGSGVTGLPS